MSEYYNISLPQPVVLTNRLMADNTCGAGPCEFSYFTDSNSPKLSSMSQNSISSAQSLTFAATNCDLGSPLVIFTNKQTSFVTAVVPTSFNAHNIVLTAPNIESGQYNVRIRVDPVG